MNKGKETRMSVLKMSNIVFGILLCTMVSVVTVCAQDDVPFTFIRVGDMDGSGFGKGGSNVNAAGQSVNVDGIGQLYGGDFLPDGNRGGSVQANQGDDFDNRDGAEHGDSRTESRGATINSGTKGSWWTDRNLPWGVYPEFVFDFSVKEGMIDTEADIYFNMIFGDYDNHGGTIEISNSNGVITTLTPTLQNQVEKGESNDGLIQTAYYTVKFDDVFHTTKNGYHIGYFKAVFNNISDPFLTFDFAELGAEPIRADIILAPGPTEIEAKDYELVAGDTVTLGAVVTDIYYEVYNTDYSDFDWNIVSDNEEPGDAFVVANNGKTSFTTTRAHRTVQVQVKYTDPDNNKTVLRDTIYITIIPADPYGLDIEPTEIEVSETGLENDHVSIEVIGDEPEVVEEPEEQEPDTTNLNVVIIDTTHIETTITKSISTLVIEMNDNRGVVGKDETAEITITAGDFESHTLELSVTIEFPKGADLVIILEHGDDDGVYVGTEDLYEQLQEYAGERITLEASFEDSYGEIISAELEVDVYKKIPLDMSDADFRVSVVRSMIDYSEQSGVVTERIGKVVGAGNIEEGESFMLYIASEDGGMLSYNNNNNTFEQGVMTSAKDFIGPTFNLEIISPEISGDLSPEDAELEGKPEWNSTVSFDAHFYDTQGQFIRKVGYSIVVSEEHISDIGTANLYFEWMPELVDANPALTSEQGRQLQAGVIIAAINSRVVFILQNDYGDLDAGTVREWGGSMFHNFGYIRNNNENN